MPAPELGPIRARGQRTRRSQLGRESSECGPLAQTFFSPPRLEFDNQSLNSGPSPIGPGPLEVSGSQTIPLHNSGRGRWALADGGRIAGKRERFTALKNRVCSSVERQVAGTPGGLGAIPRKVDLPDGAKATLRPLILRDQ